MAHLAASSNNAFYGLLEPSAITNILLFYDMSEPDSYRQARGVDVGV